jgi:hypothetical protein
MLFKSSALVVDGSFVVDETNPPLVFDLHSILAPPFLPNAGQSRSAALMDSAWGFHDRGGGDDDFGDGHDDDGGDDADADRAVGCILPQQPVLRGRAAVAAFWRLSFNAGPKTANATGGGPTRRPPPAAATQGAAVHSPTAKGHGGDGGGDEDEDELDIVGGTGGGGDGGAEWRLRIDLADLRVDLVPSAGNVSWIR